ncbi:MAG: matrixin family metalloprotease, partial [Candidatus Obscuribacterales bacterium]|nr:matrixin family metalloprotease [Candidatus Obscuribacterales bacterium]
HLLTELPDRQMTDAEVRKAYLHEVGHAFGIAGHSSDPHDIMYKAVCSQQQPTLDDRDIATINHLYGQEPEQQQITIALP